MEVGSLSQYVKPLANEEYRSAQSDGEIKAASKVFKAMDESSPMELSKVKSRSKSGPLDLLEAQGKGGKLNVIA